MPSDSSAQPLKSLSNVNWFTIVIVKSVDTPLAVADFLFPFIKTGKEGTNLLANGRNIGGKANGFCLSDRWLFGS
jgi:hypothetical protein